MSTQKCIVNETNKERMSKPNSEGDPSKLQKGKTKYSFKLLDGEKSLQNLPFPINQSRIKPIGYTIRRTNYPSRTSNFQQIKIE